MRSTFHFAVIVVVVFVIAFSSFVLIFGLRAHYTLYAADEMHTTLVIIISLFLRALYNHIHSHPVIHYPHLALRRMYPLAGVVCSAVYRLLVVCVCVCERASHWILIYFCATAFLGIGGKRKVTMYLLDRHCAIFDNIFSVPFVSLSSTFRGICDRDSALYCTHTHTQMQYDRRLSILSRAQHESYHVG